MYRFLMIEDDYTQICEVVQDFFARESKGTIQVETAQDGELGLEKFYENEFDLVLLDIMLPGMNGLELCRYMRRRSVVPIIFLTAKDTEQDMMRGIRDRVRYDYYGEAIFPVCVICEMSGDYEAREGYNTRG
ncbi:MAG: response regulator [Coprococcus sp.]